MSFLSSNVPDSALQWPHLPEQAVFLVLDIEPFIFMSVFCLERQVLGSQRLSPRAEPQAAAPSGLGASA